MESSRSGSGQVAPGTDRFEIAVDDDGIAAVQKAEGTRQLRRPRQYLLRWGHPGFAFGTAFPLLDQVVLEIAAREVLADDDERLFHGASSQEHDQVRVSQAGKHTDLID